MDRTPKYLLGVNVSHVNRLDGASSESCLSEKSLTNTFNSRRLQIVPSTNPKTNGNTFCLQLLDVLSRSLTL